MGLAIPLRPEVVAEVLRLRGAGRTHQAIADALRIAKGSVYYIVHGKHRLARNFHLGLHAGELSLEQPLRCRCGARIAVLPCRTCGWRGLLAAPPRKPERPAPRRGGRPARGQRADRPERDE